MKRYGRVIGLKPEKLEEYRQLHKNVWPSVLQTIHSCNIRNYSIFLHRDLLFSYFEYVGDDFEADMAKMAADPETQKWWSLTDPCQASLSARSSPRPQWSDLEELFHED